jgi:hypothetical protein
MVGLMLDLHFRKEGKKLRYQNTSSDGGLVYIQPTAPRGLLGATKANDRIRPRPRQTNRFS